MVAAVLVGLWLVVLTPVVLSEVVERRRSSLAAFRATIAGLDRSSTGALALAGPVPAAYTAPTAAASRRVGPVRTRAQRQRMILGGFGVVALVTVAIAGVSFSRTTLALHALADQCLVAYGAAVVATNQRRRRLV